MSLASDVTGGGLRASPTQVQAAVDLASSSATSFAAGVRDAAGVGLGDAITEPLAQISTTAIAISVAVVAIAVAWLAWLAYRALA